MATRKTVAKPATRKATQNKKSDPTLCLACVAAGRAKPNKAVSRALCATCLAHARAKINRGEITEAQLISRGLMAPAQNRGPKRKSSMAEVLSRKSH